MLFFFTLSVFCEILEKCNLDSYDGLVITKYYRETCPHCQRIAPHLKEIHDRLKVNSIKVNVRNVECSKCSNCRSDEIDAVPTIVLSKDGNELGRFRGYREYDDVVKFMVKYTKLDKKIFENNSQNSHGKVIKLKEKDFYSGFNGPWLILFYKKNSDKQRELIKEIASVYDEKLKVGEISESEASNIAFKYNIGNEPVILAFYNGLNAEYTGEGDLPSLIDFCDTLINPSLNELSLDEFDLIDAELKPGDPIFIIFYTDSRVTNAYFKRPAHEFKYKVKMYKTSDKKLFEKANIYPKTKLNSNDPINDSDTAILTVYRNKTFFSANIDISDIDVLYNWIFHAHYPDVTRITNENFYTIFHGFKAVTILLTKDENLVEDFESFSNNRHFGVPFADQIFAVLDLKLFPIFAKMLFPKNNIPSLVFYNPTDRKFYGNDKKLVKERFFEMSVTAIKDFEKGKLYRYPYSNHNMRNICILAIIVLGVCGFCYSKKPIRSKIE